MQQKELLRRGLMRMIQRKLAMALGRWCEWYDELLEQRRLLEAAYKRWTQQALSQAWNTWVSKMVYPGDESESESVVSEQPSETSNEFAFLVPWAPGKQKPTSRWSIKKPSPKYQSKCYKAPEVGTLLSATSTRLSRNANRARSRDASYVSTSTRMPGNLSGYHARLAV